MTSSAIRSGLNQALQSIIPGLQTMDAPLDLEAGNGSSQDAVIIDMDADNSRLPLPGGGQGGGSRAPEGEGPSEGDREGRQGGRGGITDSSSIAHYLSEGCAELLLFAVILAIKLAYDHRVGLTVLVGLVGTFVHHSSRVKREIDLKEKRSILSLVFRLALLLFNIIFVYYVLEEQQLYKCLIFLKPNIEEMSLWAVLWCIGITDFVIKYSTLILKCLVTLLPAAVLGFKKRGKIYRSIEELSQMFRLLPPCPLWISYFSDQKETHWIVCYILTFAYIILKAFTVYRKQKDLRKSLMDLLIDVQYGKTPSDDQIRRVGEACPICQDSFHDPIQLTCKHIFCEDCVALWFDREQTCPMCRAQIVSSPIWRDGSTAMSVQLF